MEEEDDEGSEEEEENEFEFEPVPGKGREETEEERFLIIKKQTKLKKNNPRSNYVYDIILTNWSMCWQQSPLRAAAVRKYIFISAALAKREVIGDRA